MGREATDFFYQDEHSKALELGAERERQYAVIVAARRAAYLAWKKDLTERQIVREYIAAGLGELPDGELVSLSLLMSLGWKIVQNSEGKNVLAR